MNLFILLTLFLCRRRRRRVYWFPHCKIWSLAFWIQTICWLNKFKLPTFECSEFDFIFYTFVNVRPLNVHIHKNRNTQYRYRYSSYKPYYTHLNTQIHSKPNQLLIKFHEMVYKFSTHFYAQIEAHCQCVYLLESIARGLASNQITLCYTIAQFWHLKQKSNKMNDFHLYCTHHFQLNDSKRWIWISKMQEKIYFSRCNVPKSR